MNSERTSEWIRNTTHSPDHQLMFSLMRNTGAIFSPIIFPVGLFTNDPKYREIGGGGATLKGTSVYLVSDTRGTDQPTIDQIRSHEMSHIWLNTHLTPGQTRIKHKPEEASLDQVLQQISSGQFFGEVTPVSDAIKDYIRYNPRLTQYQDNPEVGLHEWSRMIEDERAKAQLLHEMDLIRERHSLVVPRRISFEAVALGVTAFYASALSRGISRRYNLPHAFEEGLVEFLGSTAVGQDFETHPNLETVRFAQAFQSVFPNPRSIVEIISKNGYGFFVSQYATQVIEKS